MAGSPKKRARRAAEESRRAQQLLTIVNDAARNATLRQTARLALLEIGENVMSTFDNDGRELMAPPPESLDPMKLAARLQQHALGKAIMDSTQVTAAGKLLDHLAKRPEAPPPVAASIVVPSSVGDDEALQAYLKMLEQ